MRKEEDQNENDHFKSFKKPSKVEGQLPEEFMMQEEYENHEG